MPMKADRMSRLQRKVLEQVAVGTGWEANKLSGHCKRRGATKAAREARAAGRSKASLEDIDLHFKWGLNKLKKKMQVYYSGLRPLSERLEVSAYI